MLRDLIPARRHLPHAGGPASWRDRRIVDRRQKAVHMGSAVGRVRRGGAFSGGGGWRWPRGWRLQPETAYSGVMADVAAFNRNFDLFLIG